MGEWTKINEQTRESINKRMNESKHSNRQMNRTNKLMNQQMYMSE